MDLKVVTPKGSKVEATVSQVTAPGELGDLGILPGHRALLTSVGIGLLGYTSEGKVCTLAVNGGYLEVADDTIVVITETAEAPDEIDPARAETARAKAVEELHGLDSSNGEAFAAATARLKRAENRLAASRLVRPDIPV